MKNAAMVQVLQESDFHVDELGRVVIDNQELMREINGAAGAHGLQLSNGACVNASCH